MNVTVDVYTKDVDAAVEAFKKAIESGATNINLRSIEDYETNEFASLNLMFESDHSSEAITMLDNGSFSRDSGL